MKERTKIKKFILEMIDRKTKQTIIISLLFIIGIHLDLILKYINEQSHRVILDLGYKIEIVYEMRLATYLDYITDILYLFNWIPMLTTGVIIYIIGIYMFNTNIEDYYRIFRLIRYIMNFWLFGILVLNIFSIILCIGQFFWYDAYFLSFVNLNVYDLVFVILISIISSIISFIIYNYVHKAFNVQFLEKYFKIGTLENETN